LISTISGAPHAQQGLHKDSLPSSRDLRYTVAFQISEQLYTDLVGVHLKDEAAVSRMTKILALEDVRVYRYRQYEARRNKGLEVEARQGVKFDCQHRPILLASRKVLTREAY
jgi:hypothetical protein